MVEGSRQCLGWEGQELHGNGGLEGPGKVSRKLECRANLGASSRSQLPRVTGNWRLRLPMLEGHVGRSTTADPPCSRAHQRRDHNMGDLGQATQVEPA